MGTAIPENITRQIADKQVELDTLLKRVARSGSYESVSLTEQIKQVAQEIKNLKQHG